VSSFNVEKKSKQTIIPAKYSLIADTLYIKKLQFSLKIENIMVKPLNQTKLSD